MKIYKIIIPTLLFASFGWGSSNETAKLSVFFDDPTLEMNPVELAIAHHRRGNLIKWMGCYGYAKFLPGVPNDVKYNDSDVHWLKGTSDAILNAKHATYNETALDFARAYNEKRLELKTGQPIK